MYEKTVYQIVVPLTIKDYRFGVVNYDKRRDALNNVTHYFKKYGCSYVLVRKMIFVYKDKTSDKYIYSKTKNTYRYEKFDWFKNHVMKGERP